MVHVEKAKIQPAKPKSISIKNNAPGPQKLLSNIRCFDHIKKMPVTITATDATAQIRVIALSTNCGSSRRPKCLRAMPRPIQKDPRVTATNPSPTSKQPQLTSAPCAPALRLTRAAGFTSWQNGHESHGISGSSEASNRLRQRGQVILSAVSAGSFAVIAVAGRVATGSALSKDMIASVMIAPQYGHGFPSDRSIGLPHLGQSALLDTEFTPSYALRGPDHSRQ